MKNQIFKKSVLFWIAFAVGLTLLFFWTKPDPNKLDKVLSYSEFLEVLEKGDVVHVQINEEAKKLKVTINDEKEKKAKTVGVNLLKQDTFLVNDLKKYNVSFSADPMPEPPSQWGTFLLAFGPVLLMIGVWIWFMKKQTGAGGKSPFSFGKNKAKRLEKENNKTVFSDVAGCDEAKQDVAELVDFLRDPVQYNKLGAKIPRGLLLVGPPGTGKTLLAKAVAGEADVPFFSISGSDFVEMFVGVGAARVRDLFEEAKKNAPCIIFIDEIDAVGRRRGTGMGGGNDEREQTLNQMLVEMDGFEENSGIIVIAATNRPDVLDPALLRPGRFDRQVTVGLPDIRGREQILTVHIKKVPQNGVNINTLARGTAGFSGADLANLVNEAALFAARRKNRYVEMIDFEKAKDKIMMGAERNSAIMPQKELKNTAYHESGHAIVAKLLPGADPVHKVTIIPRGRALGVTMQLPEEDRYAHDKVHLLNQICILMAGRIAEEIFMNQMTTGASNDFMRATQIARKMVCEWGMSKNIGVMVYTESEASYLGDSSRMSAIAEQTKVAIDAEIKLIIQEQYNRAYDLLTENKHLVEKMTSALLEIETLEMNQIDDIMNGREISQYDAGLEAARERKERIQENKKHLDWNAKENLA